MTVSRASDDKPAGTVAGHSQHLPKVLGIMLKDDLGHTVLGMQDERGINRDVGRWCRRPFKAPFELSAHHCVMLVSGACPADAHWLNHPTPDIPRTSDGKPAAAALDFAHADQT